MDIDLTLALFFGNLVAAIVVHSFLAANKPHTLTKTYIRLSQTLFIVFVLLEMVFSIFLMTGLEAGKVYTWSYFEAIMVDNIGAILILITTLLFILAAIFSIYYIKPDFFNTYGMLFYALNLGIVLVFVSHNFFLLFIFWEFMVLTGYVLVIYDKTPEAFEAGYKYLVISSIGSLSVLCGLGLLTSFSPTLNFGAISPDILTTFTGKLALGLMVLGFGVTGGIVGMNQWLADAHPAAPAPVSALLSGVIVKGGVFAIFRTLSELVPNLSVGSSILTAMIAVGLVTMTEGNLMVLAQFQRKDRMDFKRILAYSTTVHLGFLLLIVGINTPLARLALVYHILNHALAKGLLFFISGYFIHEYKTKDIRDLKSFSLASSDKMTMFAMFVALMSLGGLPLTGGFVSKLLIVISLFNETVGASNGTAVFLLIALIIAVINSAFAFGTYLWLIKDLIFDTNVEEPVTPKINHKNYLNIFFVSISLIIILLGIMPFLILGYVTPML